ncbi:MAG: carboxypeptidase regulatory-like domain-containing protein, partial [Chloroflexi bacterium]|nr:carboxypeptidase regulatory-like domain-containing protein [Chloroflexota bacterium]
MVEDEGKKEEKFDFDSAGEVPGYISLEQARVLAIEHARDNTDFYGPRYRNRRLVWEVVSAEEGEDFYEVRLSYRPAGRFRGTPGVEQFTIDKTGGVRIRQILDEPVPKGLPRWLLAVTGLAVVAAAVLAFLVFLAPEQDDEPTTAASVGATASPVPVGAPAAAAATAPAGTMPIEVLLGTPAFFEDFEGGGPFGIGLGPGADIVCEQDNCFLRQVAEGSVEPGADFGDPSWQDYVLQFRFNVRTNDGGPAVTWRQSGGDRYSLHGDKSSGFTLSAFEGEQEFFADGIRAPFSVREWHTLSIETEGNHIAIFLDGSLIAEHDVPADRVPLRGDVNLHTDPFDGRAVEVWYDDVEVFLLEEAPARAAAPLSPTPTPQSAAAVTPPTPAPAPVVVPAPTTGGGAGMTRGATISGTVRDADTGLPIAGVNVAVDTEQGGFYTESQTEAGGTYAVTGLALGQYRVWADGQERGYVKLHYDGRVLWDDADIVSVTGSQEITGIDFNLSIGATISGRVTDADSGLPISDLAISADLDRGGAGAYTFTDAQGNYLLAGLAPGRYRVQAKPQDSEAAAAYVEEYYNGTAQYDDAALITVATREEIGGIDFALRVGGSITGRVVDAATGLPVRDVDVFADFARGEYAANAFTDFDGRYTIAGLGPGSYRVGVNARQLGYIDEFYGDPEFGDLVDITGSEAVSGIDFSLGVGAIISGVVTDAETGVPLEGVGVSADFADGGGASYSRTDAFGFYVLTGLPPGVYKVSVEPEDSALTMRYVREFYDDTLLWEDADLITIAGAEEVTGIDFQLDVGATISGRVTDAATGQPLSGVGVSREVAQGGVYFEVRTRTDGTYELVGLAPGLYRIGVSGFDQGYMEQFYSGRQRYDEADFLSIGRGEQVTGIDFSLSVGASIS